ncbi:heat stress transcription factor A-3 [Tanacetum coccineum]
MITEELWEEKLNRLYQAEVSIMCRLVATEDDSTSELEHLQSTVNELDYMVPKIRAQCEMTAILQQHPSSLKTTTHTLRKFYKLQLQISLDAELNNFANTRHDTIPLLMYSSSRNLNHSAGSWKLQAASKVLPFVVLVTIWQSKDQRDVNVASIGKGEMTPQPLECLQGTQIPPFLSKTFDLVNDPILDPIISWGSSGQSFIV